MCFLTVILIFESESTLRTRIGVMKIKLQYFENDVEVYIPNGFKHTRDSSNVEIKGESLF